MARSSKGSQFEREFSKRLSLWWSDGERDDMFWRSSNSGGRATTRRKSGVETFKQCGDIAATHPAGLPLLDLISFELKRGYDRVTVGELFDKGPRHKKMKWELFWEQCKRDAELNDSFGWMLVTKRDGREAMAWTPRHLAEALHQFGVPLPSIRFRYDGSYVFGCTLQQWLDNTTADDVRDVIRTHLLPAIP